jgi:hypothetical protein
LNLSSDAAGREDINCHFIICNGHVGRDGQIQPTGIWQEQSPASRQSRNHMRPAAKNRHTIYICIITNSRTSRPTGFQIKRTEALVEELCREFNIRSESILYPDNWL